MPSDFPYPTLFVNAIGCLLIGIFYGVSEDRNFFNVELRGLFAVGFLGGFTTFSTFGYETFAMLREAEYLRAILNVGVQVLLGLALVWLGYNLATSR
mgnify:CR=1 FL=1